MKFMVARQEFTDLISYAQSIVSQKPPIPMLANVLLEAKDNTLTMTATDLTVGVRRQCNCKVTQPGTVALPLRVLNPLIRELTADMLELTVDQKACAAIVAGTSTFKVHGMSAEGFPQLPDFTSALKIELKQSELKDLFFRTSFAVSKEESRYVFTGVCLQVQGGTLLLIGTDGKRLARASHPLTIDPEAKAECIIPLKAVEEIVKGMKNDDQPITLSLMPDKIAAEAANTLITSKLLVGDYPDVDRVIPKEIVSYVPLHREELASLLRQVSLFTTDANHSARFTFAAGELQLMANKMEVGEGNVSMPVNYENSQFDIAFNPHFFLDILRHCKKEVVLFGYSDSFNPGIILDGEEKLQPGSAYPPLLYVLMSMRLSEASHEAR